MICYEKYQQDKIYIYINIAIKYIQMLTTVTQEIWNITLLSTPKNVH